MSLVLAVDPGTTESAYVIVDAALRPVEFAKLANGELLGLIYRREGRWQQLTACAIEMPGVAMMTGAEVFTTCRWVGNFEQAWNHEFSVDAQLVYRKDVKMHLLGRTNQKGADKLVRAALIAKHGGPSSIKKGGELYGVTGDCWAALAVAHTFLEAPRGTPPGQADAARKQNRILWNTGTDQLDESRRFVRHLLAERRSSEFITLAIFISLAEFVGVVAVLHSGGFW